MDKHEKAIEAAAKARYEQWWRGFTPEEQEYIRQGIRKEVAAFLRSVEPSGHVIEAMHNGSVNVPLGEYAGVFRAGCLALAEEIA